MPTDAELRERFEAWAKAKLGYHDFATWSDAPEAVMVIDEYRDTMIQVRWQAWQAAYLAGQQDENEACARVCEDIAENHDPMWATANDCAAAIRARMK
jgi:hypothetical protein